MLHLIDDIIADVIATKIEVIQLCDVNLKTIFNLQIDLDTIDVSNLNRQFLFHKEHVGKSKAEVARKSALSFNPNVQIKAYHDSILR